MKSVVIGDVNDIFVDNCLDRTYQHTARQSDDPNAICVPLHIAGHAPVVNLLCSWFQKRVLAPISDSRQ